ncbi:MAG TPA: hypothetical protein VH307_10680 [Streptosporangiaceae bacterium]|jgi:hypothetical protein|nr:hypothetical protein [Streptosporangiaceae bacterium]
MQALSVPQPWAWTVARGYKTYLNCAFDTCHRGPLAIYASFRAETSHVRSQAVREANGNSADPAAAIGGIVAVVNLTGVCTAGRSGRPCGCGPWAFAGSYHWQVADPRPLRLPVLALGQPVLWELAPAVAAAVARMAGLPELAGVGGTAGR